MPIILSGLHLIIRREALDKKKGVEIVFVYYIVICIGIQSLFLGFVDYAFPGVLSEYRTWTESTYLTLLASANIGFGTIGILSIWFKGGWRSATALGGAISFLLCSYVDLQFQMEKGHWNIFLIGPSFISNILNFVPLFVLLFLRYRFNKA